MTVSKIVCLLAWLSVLAMLWLYAFDVSNEFVWMLVFLAIALTSGLYSERVQQFPPKKEG